MRKINIDNLTWASLGVLLDTQDPIVFTNNQSDMLLFTKNPEIEVPGVDEDGQEGIKRFYMWHPVSLKMKFYLVKTFPDSFIDTKPKFT